MWAYGDNWSGQLGSLEIDSEITQPICISDIETNPLYGIVITDISLSAYDWNEYGLALDNTGKVYYFGSDSDDYLGAYSNLEPTCLNTMEDSPLDDVVITKISAGSPWNALFLDSNGKVWSFLAGGDDEAGTGNANDNGLPICINDVSGNPLTGVVITDIAAGYSNSMAIDSNGNLWSWGENYGQGDDDSVNIPVCLSQITTNPLYGTKIVKISSGAWHSLALDNQGNVWGYGRNYDGELVVNTDTYTPICLSDYEDSGFYNKTITNISAGWENTGLVDNEGNYYLYGNLNYTPAPC